MRVFYVILFLGVLLACGEKKIERQPTTVRPILNHANELPPLPKELIFCGQRLNLEDVDIRERLDREILVNAYFQSSTTQALKRANRFFPEMEMILKKHNIPEDMKYLAVIESGLVQAVSPAGAQGFWQFMPFTAKEHGLLLNEQVDERLNIRKSTIAACEYLSYAHDTLNDWVLAAASYNRGIGGVRSDMKWQGTDNYFDTHMNSETGRYVFRILAMKIIFENPEAYGYKIDKKELYEPYKTYSVKIKKSISNLAKWSQTMGVNYKILIKLNPWILGNHLTVNKGEYEILLPRKNCKLKPYEKYN